MHFMKHILDVPGFAPEIISLPELPLEALHELIHHSDDGSGWTVARRLLGNETVMVWSNDSVYSAGRWMHEVVTRLITTIISRLPGPELPDSTLHVFLHGTTVHMDCLEFDYTDHAAWYNVRAAIAETTSRDLTPLWLNQFCPAGAEGDMEKPCYWVQTADDVRIVNGKRSLTLPRDSNRLLEEPIISAFVGLHRPRKVQMRFSTDSIMTKVYALSKRD